MFYIIVYPRPLGAEPKIYSTKPPEAIVESVEIEPGYFMDDPWGGYEILEFESIFLARLWFKQHYPSSYDELETDY